MRHRATDAGNRGLTGALRRDFGLDLDDESWIARIRPMRAPTQYGRLGPYELLGQVGRGGQGIVFKARQPRTGRTIVLKRLSAGAFATPEMRARFEREVRTAAALNHPNIVTVFGSEVIEGQTVLAMEWIDGVPFDRWAKAQKREVREILRACCLACDAIEHAHQRGIVHRDLKPSNILVDAAGQPHILDFGLAKATNRDVIPAFDDDSGAAASLTRTGDFLGTPAFAAPEQLHADAEVSASTDVYALGAVLYHALTGRLLFPNSLNLADLMDAIRERDPPAPSLLQPRIDREIDAIILKALAKEPRRRYESVAALADDIRRYLHGRPVLAHPPSAAYRTRKFVWKHRAALIVAGGCTALLLGATVVSGIYRAQALDSSREREDAERIAVNAELESLFERAGDLVSKGKSEEAEAHYRDLLEKRRALVGDQHESTAAVALELGKLLYAAGRYEEADALLTLAFDVRLRLYGRQSPLTASAATALGLVRFEQADYAGAESAFRLQDEYCRATNAAFLTRRYALLAVMSSLNFQGRWTDGLAFAKEMADLFRVHYSQPGQKYPLDNQVYVARAYTWLGFQLRICGEDAAAQDAFSYGAEILEPILAAWRTNGQPKGMSGVYFDYLLRELGFILVELGRLDEAEKLLRESLPLWEKARHRKDPPRRGVAIAALGDCLFRQGRFAEAEPLLLEGLKNLQGLWYYQYRLEAALRLIDLYEASGHPAKAEYWRECVRTRPHRLWGSPGEP